jgi:D-sedoheptulose 7-phosphate isomerase
MMTSEGDFVQGTIDDYLSRVTRAVDTLPRDDVRELVGLLHGAYREGRTVFIVGNGGSAATASHMACDLSKNIFQDGSDVVPSRFRVLALTDNAAFVTAIANDLGYASVFAKQLEALADPGDVLVALSASGNSPNVIEATLKARKMGLVTIGILGFGGGRMKDLVDLPVVVDSHEYGPVEDSHLVLNHLVANSLRALIAR